MSSCAYHLPSLNVFFTVWSNLFWENGGALQQSGIVQSGQTLLVHGAAGGIGSMAVSVAKSLKCTVIGTVSSEEKRKYVENELGADKCFDLSASPDFSRDIREWLGPKENVDACLDILGGDAVASNISLLRRGGRHISIGLLRGTSATIDLVHVLARGVTLSGSTLRRRSDEEKAAILRDAQSRYCGMAVPLGSSAFIMRHSMLQNTRIHSCFPLEDAQKAHELMESRSHIGKIILKAF